MAVWWKSANNTPRVYMRSLATRKSGMELSAAVKDAIRVARAAHFDLIIAPEYRYQWQQLPQQHSLSVPSLKYR